MNEHDLRNLKKLADDLGHLRAFRLAGIVIVVLAVGWVAAWGHLVAYNKPMPDLFNTTGSVIGIFLVITTILMLFNFDKLRETKEDLESLMIRSEREAALLNLLRPMLKDAFRLEPASNIRPALIERLINSIIAESAGDEAAVSRTFLLHQPEPVKVLVRQQCRQLLMAKQRQLEIILTEATNKGVLLDPCQRGVLNVEIQQIEQVLDLILEAPDSKELKVGRYHVFHVPEAHN